MRTLFKDKEKAGGGMNKLLVVLLYLGLAGCASTPMLNRPPVNERMVYVQTQSVEPDIKNAIIHGLVIKGMTREDVLTSWGKPIRKFGRDNTGLEEWQYSADIMSIENKTVSFQDGVVTGWHWQL